MSKKLFAAAVVGLLLVIACLGFGPPRAAAQQPVIVELFTSEGCSDCPAADALLTQLSRQRDAGRTELILLEEHVDYWNSTGWFDRFSSSDFTDRQNRYVKQFRLATAYTPQMVVDGRFQGVGNSVSGVKSMLMEASSNPKSSTVSLRFVAPGKLAVTVDDSTHGRQKVLLAVTEDNLTTNVRGGENGGRVLTHSAVVRNFKTLGNTADGKFETTADLPAKSDWKKQDLRAAVIVQDPASGQIVGAASIPYPSASSATAGR
jgi:hypothetical protein